MKKETNIYEILHQLQKRKALYLGNDYNFKCLDSFILGFSIAATPQQMETQQFPSFHFFSTWLLGHLKKHFGLSGGWHWQIHNRNLTNDKSAFDEFFTFLETFKQATINKKNIILDNDALEFYQTSPVKKYNTVGGKEILNTNIPIKIIWTNISDSTTVWMDYVGKDGNLLEGTWHINETEALKKLSSEFGILKTI